MAPRELRPGSATSAGGSRGDEAPRPGPLSVLLDRSKGRALRLPPHLSSLYGPLRAPSIAGRPWVMANFASTLDGVVALHPTGSMGAGEITGADPHDRLVMALLRGVADAVIVGAGTLRSVPRHLWTAERLLPGLAKDFGDLRQQLGLAPRPRIVVVSGRGRLDPNMRLFQTPGLETLVVTSPEGEARLRRRRFPAPIAARTSRGPAGALDPAEVLRAVGEAGPARRLLVEGGPHLMGDFLRNGCVDTLFLTLSSQVAGRDGRAVRWGFAEGGLLAPGHPLWGTLESVRQGGSMLFLRYAIGARTP